MNKRLLFVGDAACPSGFARATHGVLDVARHTFDVTVLGINYRGDPDGRKYPYDIYPAYAGGDFMGVKRLIWMCDVVKPDVIVIQNDGWNIPAYVEQLQRFDEYKNVPVIAIVAVDGKNFMGPWLNHVTHTIFWTQFALDEARAGGFDGKASVIPLGVDLDTYHPMDKKECRRRKGLGALTDMFIVGNVNRNQHRKRWDLTMKYFAEWVHGGKHIQLRSEVGRGTYRIPNAYLFLHGAPTGDTAIKVQQLAVYYRIITRLILVEPPVWYGVEEPAMADTYNCFDLNISTTQGEGFGLTTLEAMACGVPCILPEWSGLGDWAKGAAWMVPCSTTAVGPPYVNVIGGIPDEKLFIQALDALYQYPQYREQNSAAALERASEERFRWPVIGQMFTNCVSSVVTPEPAHV